MGFYHPVAVVKDGQRRGVALPGTTHPPLTLLATPH